MQKNWLARFHSAYNMFVFAMVGHCFIVESPDSYVLFTRNLIQTHGNNVFFCRMRVCCVLIIRDSNGLAN